MIVLDLFLKTKINNFKILKRVKDYSESLLKLSSLSKIYSKYLV